MEINNNSNCQSYQYDSKCNICQDEISFSFDCNTCKKIICIDCVYKLLSFTIKDGEPDKIKTLRNGKIVDLNDVQIGYKCPYCRELNGLLLNECKFIIGLICNSTEITTLKSICNCSFCCNNWPLLKIKHHPCKKKSCYHCEHSILELYLN